MKPKYKPKSEEDKRRIEKLVAYSKNRARYDNISGNKYNSLTAIKKIPSDGGQVKWLFKCDCGVLRKVRVGSVVSGLTKSCGCIVKSPREKKTIGKKFGMLTAIKPVDSYTGKNGKSYQNRVKWLFDCECGTQFIGVLSFIKKQKMASCGCAHSATQLGAENIMFKSYQIGAKKRNLDFTLEFSDFQALVNTNCFYCDTPPKERDYSYKVFKPKLNGIDRKNNDLGYTKENSLPCCTECNYFKRTLPYEKFLTLTKRIALAQTKKNYQESLTAKIGDTLLDLEVVLDKMCDQGLQLGDILSLVYSHVWVHRQDAIEVYTDDNSRPIMKYGHKDQI